MSQSYRARESDGVGALVCGILSLFMCGIILGPIAIHLGGQSSTGMARAGRILGTIAVVLWAIGLLGALLNLLATNGG